MPSSARTYANEDAEDKELQTLEDRVRKLRQKKKKLQSKLKDLREKQESSLRQQHENESLLTKLLQHKLIGPVIVKEEHREFVVEFNASVKGKYCEPYYLRYRKTDTGSYDVLRYFLPDSIYVRNIVQEYPLVGDKELVNFIRYVQRCVVAYESRKSQILRAKELSSSLRIFNCPHYRFIEITLKILDTKDGKNLNVIVDLTYECEKDLPSSCKVTSKDADIKKIQLLKDRMGAFTELRLEDAVELLFLKDESSSVQSTESETQERGEEEEEETNEDEEWKKEKESRMQQNQKKRKKQK